MSNDAEEVGGGEVHESLETLGGEVTAARNQMIKTANAVSNLAAEVRDLARQQQRQRRRIGINTLGAYAIFVLLVAGAAYLIYQARVDRVEFEKNVLRRQHAAMQTQLERLRDAERKRRATETEAMSFYQLIKGQQLHQAIKRYPEVARLPLSKVEAALFESWVQRKRASLAYNAYAAGMRAVGEQSWKRAVVELRRSLELVAQPPHAASLRFYLGVALSKLGSNREAATELETALKLRAEKLVSKHVRYLLGTIYQSLGQREKARDAYRIYLQRHPKGSHRRLARLRLRALKKK
ncbi:MAG: hypothetical protein CSA24_00405 [Deltaproteobacteria bacterium]|nr:MAG: hypothetical protein CSB49_02995 [Pseudomonadota bacterium]PIE66357.1 MAG: hypothetical protein CSA24_00405 [Deltaproteobacteria bacterium]